MRRLLGVLAAVLALAGCAIPNPLDASTAGPLVIEPVARLLVVPDSPHVTDVKHVYPTRCRARTADDGGALPDARCTPGSITPATKADVCGLAYNTGRRPPTAETSKLKKITMQAYGSRQSARVTELDHLVPEWAGGSNDATNLWPQPSDLPGADWRNSKDDAETDAKWALCRPGSTLTLAQVQETFAGDWTQARVQLGLPA